MPDKKKLDEAKSKLTTKQTTNLYGDLHKLQALWQHRDAAVSLLGSSRDGVTPPSIDSLNSRITLLCNKIAKDKKVVLKLIDANNEDLFRDKVVDGDKRKNPASVSALGEKRKRIHDDIQQGNAKRAKLNPAVREQVDAGVQLPDNTPSQGKLDSLRVELESLDANVAEQQASVRENLITANNSQHIYKALMQAGPSAQVFQFLDQALPRDKIDDKKLQARNYRHDSAKLGNAYAEAGNKITHWLSLHKSRNQAEQSLDVARRARDGHSNSEGVDIPGTKALLQSAKSDYKAIPFRFLRRLFGSKVVGKAYTKYQAAGKADRDAKKSVKKANESYETAQKKIPQYRKSFNKEIAPGLPKESHDVLMDVLSVYEDKLTTSESVDAAINNVKVALERFQRGHEAVEASIAERHQSRGAANDNPQANIALAENLAQAPGLVADNNAGEPAQPVEDIAPEPAAGAAQPAPADAAAVQQPADSSVSSTVSLPASSGAAVVPPQSALDNNADQAAAANRAVAGQAGAAQNQVPAANSVDEVAPLPQQSGFDEPASPVQADAPAPAANADQPAVLDGTEIARMARERAAQRQSLAQANAPGEAQPFSQGYTQTTSNALNDNDIEQAPGEYREDWLHAGAPQSNERSSNRRAEHGFRGEKIEGGARAGAHRPRPTQRQGGNYKHPAEAIPTLTGVGRQTNYQPMRGPSTGDDTASRTSGTLSDDALSADEAASRSNFFLHPDEQGVDAFEPANFSDTEPSSEPSQDSAEVVSLQALNEGLMSEVIQPLKTVLAALKAGQDVDVDDAQRGVEKFTAIAANLNEASSQRSGANDAEVSEESKGVKDWVNDVKPLLKDAQALSPKLHLNSTALKLDILIEKMAKVHGEYTPSKEAAPAAAQATSSATARGQQVLPNQSSDGWPPNRNREMSSRAKKNGDNGSAPSQSGPDADPANPPPVPPRRR